MNISDKVLEDIGQRLAKLRKLKFPHDNQETFAARIRSSRKTLSRMETGQPGVALSVYIETAKILGVLDQFDTLFSREKIEANQQTTDELDRILNLHASNP